MTAWVGIIGTLLGTILGGGFALVSTRLQQRYQDKRERKRLLLSKMEELLTVINQYRTIASKDIAHINGKRIAESSEEHRVLYASDLPQISGDEDLPPKGKIDMLVSIYAPELRELYEKFMDSFFTSRYECNDVHTGYLMHWDEKAKSNARVQANVSWNKFDDTCRAMESQVIDIARRYI